MSHLRKHIFSTPAPTAFGEIIAVAGADQTVEAISEITTLDGTGSSSTVGGGVTGYLWEVVIGSGLIIDSPTSSTTDISGTAVVGETVIRLTVTDANGNIDVDELTITIEIGDPLTVTDTIPDANQDGTMTITNGQPNEVLQLQYRLLNGDNPDSMSATYGGGTSAIFGVLNYINFIAFGEVTLDGNGELSISYNGNGQFFQVEYEVTGRSSSYPIPALTASGYIPFYS